MIVEVVHVVDRAVSVGGLTAGPGSEDNKLVFDLCPPSQAMLACEGGHERLHSAVVDGVADELS